MPGCAKKILNKNDCPSILSKRSSLKNDGENTRSGPGYLAMIRTKRTALFGHKIVKHYMHGLSLGMEHHSSMI